MDYEPDYDRHALSKALRGCYCPHHHPVGAPSVLSHHTGLNRSPFNLLFFMESKRYFDGSPGIIVLPVLDLAGIKNWNGGSYSVIILCSGFIRTITPAQMAVRIGLTATDPVLIEEASPLDMDMAVGVSVLLGTPSFTEVTSGRSPDGKISSQCSPSPSFCTRKWHSSISRPDAFGSQELRQLDEAAFLSTLGRR